MFLRLDATHHFLFVRVDLLVIHKFWKGWQKFPQKDSWQYLNSETVAWWCSLKMVFRSEARNFIKKRLQHRCFPVNVANLFKNTYFEEHLRTPAAGVKGKRVPKNAKKY